MVMLLVGLRGVRVASMELGILPTVNFLSPARCYYTGYSMVLGCFWVLVFGVWSLAICVSAFSVSISLTGVESPAFDGHLGPSGRPTNSKA